MSVLAIATAIVLSLSVLLGGATHQGYLGDVIVQIAACGLVGLCLWTLSESGRKVRFDLLEKILLGLFVLLCVVQLSPVFPGLGTRQLSIPEAAGGLLVFSHSWWERISVTPAATWAGLMSFVVPVSIFMGVAQCDMAGRTFLWRVVLALGGLAFVLGLMQVAQGAGSSLRFFAVTNSSEAVGFFANRNHFAAQLYVTLAFFGTWIATTGRQVLKHGKLKGRSALTLGAGFAVLLLLVAGLAMTRSRTGMLIAVGMVLGLGGMTMMSPAHAPDGVSRTGEKRFVLLALSLVLAIVAMLSLDQIVSRFQTDVADNLRWHLSWVTLRTAFSALPFGTGIGSFVRVYGAIEDPAHLLREYVNRAHNDLAEFLLETGGLGAALVIVGLAWLWRHAAPAWTEASPKQEEFQRALQRSATLAIAGLLLHALLDYGLRTTALSALFAFSCALLTRPPLSVVDILHAVASKQERKKIRKTVAPAAKPRGSPDLEPRPQPAWKDNVPWPEEWTSSGKPASNPSRHEP